MLRSNLCQLLCNGFCRFFSNFACQESSLLEGIFRALAVCGGRELVCPWCFTSSVWAVCQCHLLPDPSLPWHARLCWRNPGFPFITLCCLSHSTHTPLQGCLPTTGSGICACALPAGETRGSFTASRAGVRPSHARAWPATCSRSGTVCSNSSPSYSLRQRLFLPLSSLFPSA